MKSSLKSLKKKLGKGLVGKWHKDYSVFDELHGHGFGTDFENEFDSVDAKEQDDCDLKTFSEK